MVDLGRERIARLVRARRPRRLPLPGLRPAAVLVPLFRRPETGQTHLWLLRRPDDGSAHGGQVALPGGKPAAQDEDLRATALREAEEEIGLPRGDVEVFGPLDEYVTITRFRVRPFVGWVPATFSPCRNRAEADRVFHGPLATFLEPAALHEVKVGPFRRSMPSHRVDGEIVWGATFTILHRFAEILR